ncbi:hypothetical protein ACS0TY_030055 [Phlomoides rotata]
MKSDSEQLLMLKRLREVVNSTTTSLLELHPLKKTRGRPKEKCKRKDKSTKCDKSAFEYVDSII